MAKTKAKKIESSQKEELLEQLVVCRKSFGDNELWDKTIAVLPEGLGDEEGVLPKFLNIGLK